MGVVLRHDADSSPNFSALIYGGGCIDGCPVPQEAPPIFVAVSQDDVLRIFRREEALQRLERGQATRSNSTPLPRAVMDLAEFIGWSLMDTGLILSSDEAREPRQKRVH